MPNMPKMARWLTMSQSQVLDEFHSLPGSFSDGSGDTKFVFVEGTRDDRALLVAHADTVWSNDVELGFDESKRIFYSKGRTKSIQKNYGEYPSYSYGVGIGADDRAGCAILWSLRNLGHSLLITSGEEKGCVASKRIVSSEWWRQHLNTTHMFAIEFDRRGYNDLVFYDVGTNAFVEYVRKQTGYKPAYGFGTDIRYLCTLMCGVNISCGYYDEHRSEEQLYYDQWLNTLAIAKKWLSNKNLPHFPLNKNDAYEHNKTTNTYVPNAHCNNNVVTAVVRQPHRPEQPSVLSSPTRHQVIGKFFRCPKCSKRIDLRGYFLAGLECPNCKVYI